MSIFLIMLRLRLLWYVFALNMEIMLESRYICVPPTDEFLKRHNYIITCFDAITNFE